MSEAPRWKGHRLGPYRVGERYQGVPEDEGQLYEAHHVETGEPALVVIPPPGEDWRMRTPFGIRTTHFTQPDALVLHPERTARGKASPLHELALSYIRSAGALASVEDREDVQAHFAREPSPSRPPHLVRRRELAVAGMVLAAGLALLLWPHAFKEPQTRHALAPSIFSDARNPSLPRIAYPMPETPFKEQARPPCLPGLEVEIRGGCWVQTVLVAPCHPSSAEYEGKCYIPARKADPPPRSVQP